MGKDIYDYVHIYPKGIEETMAHHKLLKKLKWSSFQLHVGKEFYNYVHIYPRVHMTSSAS